ncbi:nuclear transport factor 2 family protein [Flagellimonas sp. DF-77]|uniref:nuclear transport factor 2 family protein n=1 Tax=Flagellimonas algarum TaxID=3230298 RepID=UPI003391ADB8
MRRSTNLILCVLMSTLAFGQSDTEIYLFDFTLAGDSISISGKTNISQNEGYDNQPSFFDANTILFSSTRNGQTDIRSYAMDSGTTTWLTDTPQGSEYSPTRIPESNAISAIRLDTTGLQRLYRYNIKKGTDKSILKDAKVGYHYWYDPNTLVTTVLVDNRMDLVLNDLKKEVSDTIETKVGRGLGRVPGKGMVSYVKSNNGNNDILTFDPNSKATGPLVIPIREVQDYAWHPSGFIVIAYKNILLKLDPSKGADWEPFHTFNDADLGGITRLVFSPDGRKLVLVSSTSPEAIVQKQLDAYNNRDIDAFLATYADSITLFNFPGEQTAQGLDAMRKQYQGFFESTPDLHCEIKNRIVIGNKVIDEEFLTINGQNFSAVAIYEVENGKIAKVTFLR